MGTAPNSKVLPAPGRDGRCPVQDKGVLKEPGASAFDPAQHLRTLEDGSEYLDARWRLVWFLESHSEYTITSNLVHLSAKLAVVKVTITLPGGRTAEGLGMAAAHDVYRHVETAQTHALARALAMLGFGTESALDFETDAPADAGVKRNGSNGRKGPAGVPRNGNNGKKEPASEAQATTGPKGPSEQIRPVQPKQHPQQPQQETTHLPQPPEGLPSWASLEGVMTEDAPSGTPEPAPNGNHAAGQASGGESSPQCQECLGRVKEGRTRRGKVLSPQEVADLAREKTGKVLCPRSLTQHIEKGTKG